MKAKFILYLLFLFQLNAFCQPSIQWHTQLKDAEETICDMLGKAMLRIKLTGNCMEIERGSLESGVYFVMLRNRGTQYAQKVIIE